MSRAATYRDHMVTCPFCEQPTHPGRLDQHVHDAHGITAPNPTRLIRGVLWALGIEATTTALVITTIIWAHRRGWI